MHIYFLNSHLVLTLHISGFCPITIEIGICKIANDLYVTKFSDYLLDLLTMSDFVEFMLFFIWHLGSKILDLNTVFLATPL